MKKILVVEDDVLLGKTLCYNLTLAGYTADAALSSNSARIQFENNDYDLFVLDVNLPDGNGFDLCRDIKARYENLEAVTAQYVDVRLERKNTVLETYHKALQPQIATSEKSAEQKKTPKKAKKKSSDMEL